MIHYDIQCGEDEETGEKGTWIVRRDGDRWVKIAKFIPHEYTAEDERLLGSAAGDEAERLKRTVASLGTSLRRVLELVDHADSKQPRPWCNGVHEGTSCEGDVQAMRIVEDGRAALRLTREHHMSEKRLEYDWRKQSIATARGGFYAEVGKFWCTPSIEDADDPDGDDTGWRWFGFGIGEDGKPNGLRAEISREMSLSEAQVAAENWIQVQIDARAFATAGVSRRPGLDMVTLARGLCFPGSPQAAPAEKPESTDGSDSEPVTVHTGTAKAVP